MMKQEFEDSMKPGVKYPGYATLNNYREFLFIPAQKGAREGKMKLLREGAGWSVHTTRDNIIIHMKVPRLPNRLDRIKKYLALQDEISKIFNEYDLGPTKPNKSKKK